MGRSVGARAARALALCLLVLLLTSASAGCGPGASDGQTVFVTFLDVGQGNCTLIETPWGNALIDAGLNDSEEYVSAWLAARGVGEITWMVLSHAHEDHIGGADRVIGECEVGRVILPAYSGETEPTEPCYRRLLEAAGQAGVTIDRARAGDVYMLGEVALEIIGPARDDYPPEEGNLYSLILRVRYGDCAFLLMGDAEAATEEELLARYDAAALRSNLIEVGHHGSDTSTAEALLDAVTPEYAVVSCGRNNLHGHPDARVIERLEERGVTCFRTDLEGSMIFSCDGKKIKKGQ